LLSLSGSMNPARVITSAADNFQGVACRISVSIFRASLKILARSWTGFSCYPAVMLRDVRKRFGISSHCFGSAMAVMINCPPKIKQKSTAISGNCSSSTQPLLREFPSPRGQQHDNLIFTFFVRFAILISGNPWEGVFRSYGYASQTANSKCGTGQIYS